MEMLYRLSYNGKLLQTQIKQLVAPEASVPTLPRNRVLGKERDSGAKGAESAAAFVAAANIMEGGGFEPPKAYAGRFTVCSLWPLGHPSKSTTATEPVAKLCKNEPTTGIEPVTYGLQNRCSTS